MRASTPRRSARSERSSSSFLRAHGRALAATDFFPATVLSLAGPVRYDVMSVIDLASRRVELAEIAHAPREPFIKQTARNPTDRVDGFLIGERYVIMNRDPLFTGTSAHHARSATFTVVRLRSGPTRLHGFLKELVAPLHKDMDGTTLSVRSGGAETTSPSKRRAWSARSPAPWANPRYCFQRVETTRKKCRAVLARRREERETQLLQRSLVACTQPRIKALGGLITALTHRERRLSSHGRERRLCALRHARPCEFATCEYRL